MKEYGRMVTVVAIGAGNRTNKYLEFAVRNPDRLKLVAVVEPNAIRRKALAARFGVDESACFENYEEFFRNPVKADAVIVATPDDMHFEPCMLAMKAGYHVLLEKPIAQTMEECQAILEASRRYGVKVSVGHVLRYHPYFSKIKELVASGELGRLISISDRAAVGVGRSIHGYVSGMWRKSADTNPMILSKSCHDIDFMLWLVDSPCRFLNSYGSLAWFKAGNAPEGSTDRCITCAVESDCPFSAINLYRERRDWVAGFDVPEGKTLDEVIEEVLQHGDYGRCVYRCDNDVVDHQVVSMVLEDESTLSFTMDSFTLDDNRETNICFTHGELYGNETILRVRKFRGAEETVYDFSDIVDKPFHADADVKLMEDFVDAILDETIELRTSIEQSMLSHKICFEAEASRLKHELAK